MITLKELRIGNYVLIHGAVQQVLMISSFADLIHTPSIGYKTGGDIQYIDCKDDEVEPIALTDKRMQEGGFLFHDYFKFWQRLDETPGKTMDMELDRDFTAMDFGRRPILKNIKNVHELQNLYFALKGRELPFVFDKKDVKVPA